LEFSEVTYQAPLGQFGAWLVPADNSDTWVIHVHGWRASRRETVRMLPIYHQVGITSLVIDYRNDPDAPADPTGHYRFGVSEWEEVDAAIRYARDHGAERVILSAYSTGAAGVMAFTERSDQAEYVGAIIFDAPNIDMGSTVHHAAADMDLPVIGVKVPRSLTTVAMTIAGIRWDVDWDAINYVERADRLSVPVLVFHGQDDNRVPIEVSRALQAKNPEHVKLIEVPGAGHVMSWNADPDSYQSYLREFLGSL
jgi:alpha-beta hydrolase superfamily lysophospholipase